MKRLLKQLLSWAAGFGKLLGLIAGGAGVFYGLGYLTRWIIFSFVLTDHSSEALRHIFWIFSPITGGGFGITYENIIRGPYYLAPLWHVGYNFWLGFLILAASYIILLIVWGLIAGASKLRPRI